MGKLSKYFQLSSYFPLQFSAKTFRFLSYSGCLRLPTTVLGFV